METKEIEKSIIKKFRKNIWSKFIDAINDFKMVNEGDSIAVCISGGKDSFLLAKCLQEIKRHGKVNFELKFIVMDPGYNDQVRNLINLNAKKLGIAINVFETAIFNTVDTISDDKPCYLCARMRRGYLYDYAKKLGCNKIALGHHFDDVIETILLNIIYASEMKTMMPKLKSTNFKGMELIRPLYYVKEADIIAWTSYCDLSFTNCACKFSLKKNNDSKRLEMKNLIADFRKISPYIETNIMKSAFNVNIDSVIGYKKNGVKNNFMEEYDELSSKDARDIE